MNLFFVLLLMLFLFVVVVIGLFYVGALFITGDEEISKMILKNSLKARFFKKEKEQKIEFTYSYVNEVFESYIHSISSTKNTDLQNEYNLTSEEVTRLRKVILKIKDNKEISFISETEIKKIFKLKREFTFLGSYTNSLKVFSNEEYVKLFKKLEKIVNNEFDIESLGRELSNIKDPKKQRQWNILRIRLENILEDTKKGNKKLSGKNPYLETVMASFFSEDTFKGFFKGLTTPNFEAKIL